MTRQKIHFISILFLVCIVPYFITSCGGSDPLGETPPPPEQQTPPDTSPFPPTYDDEQGPSPFGLIGDWFNPDLVAANGAGLVHISRVSWPILMPDGVSFDVKKVEQLDHYVRGYTDYGVQVFMRLTAGGHTPEDAFSGIPNAQDWPIETTDYSLPPHDGYKNGEWLGEIKDAPNSYPPRRLTRDEPGNTSPWYNYVHALASRYNGTTPDPTRPGELLPKIDYWAIAGENELKAYWYGTATELYGGIGGDPDVGTLPTFYRAVHAANPDAKVVGGSLTDGTALVCILHEKMLDKGDYDQEMLQYGNDWMRQMVPLQFTNLQNLKRRMNSQKYIRIRGFMESLLAANKYYDVLGYHTYSSYDVLDDLLQFYREKMAQYGFHKPLWGTETGIFNFPVANDETQAQRVTKLLAVSMSQGVQHVTYSGMVSLSVQGFLYAGFYNEMLVPYRMFNPNSTPEQCNDIYGLAAREAFSFFTQTMKEKEYHFDRIIRQGDTLFYTFRSATDNSRFCVAWSERDQEAFDPRAELGIQHDPHLNVFDCRGEPQQPPSSEIIFSSSPYFLEWAE